MPRMTAPKSFQKSLGTAMKRLAIAGGVGAAGVGGFKIGQRVGANKAANQMASAFSEANEIENQQIAQEYYNRGAQSSGVEKMSSLNINANTVNNHSNSEETMSNEFTSADRAAAAQSILEKLAGVGFSGADARAAEKMAREMAGSLKKARAKQELMSNLKHKMIPYAIGAGGLGAGFGGAALLSKQSSDTFAEIRQAAIIDEIEKMAGGMKMPGFAKNFGHEVSEAVGNFRAGSFSRGVPKKTAKEFRQAGVQNLKNIAKNPITIGAGSLAAGAGADAIINRK